MKKLFCCLIALVAVIMMVTFAINMPSMTFGRYMISSKSTLNFQIVASPGIYISNNLNQSLSDIRWTVIDSYEDTDDIGAFEDISPDFVSIPEPLSITTEEPTVAPTEEPIVAPTEEPTVVPTEEPTVVPTEETTVAPTEEPTVALTEEPTVAPTEEPTVAPTEEPTVTPTEEPTVTPTEEPTVTPTEEPTVTPTEEPTVTPTEEATVTPTEEPTVTPTEKPTVAPTEEPTVTPTEEPTVAPTEEPTVVPTEEPTVTPTEESTGTDIEEPSTNDLAEIQFYNSLGITSGQGIRFHVSNIDVSLIPSKLDNISLDDIHFKIRLLVPDDIHNIAAESTQSYDQTTESGESTSESALEQGFSAMALGVQLRVSSNGEDYSDPIDASYIYLSKYTSISINNPNTSYWAFTFCTNELENIYTLVGGQPSLIHFMITVNDSAIDTSRFIIMVEQHHIYE